MSLSRRPWYHSRRKFLRRPHRNWKSPPCMRSRALTCRLCIVRESVVTTNPWVSSWSAADMANSHSIVSAKATRHCLRAVLLTLLRLSSEIRKCFQRYAILERRLAPRIGLSFVDRFRYKLPQHPHIQSLSSAPCTRSGQKWNRPLSRSGQLIRRSQMRSPKAGRRTS